MTGDTDVPLRIEMERKSDFGPDAVVVSAEVTEGINSPTEMIIDLAAYGDDAGSWNPASDTIVDY